MRLQPVDSLSLTRTSLVEYFLFGIRLAHGLACILPGLVILALEPVMQTEAAKVQLGMLLVFGILSVVVFQAMGVYSEALFSNSTRLRMILFTWSAAFGLLLILHNMMGVLESVEQDRLLLWYLATLALLGIVRLLLLVLFRQQMKKGVFLQTAVILGATENACGWLNIWSSIRTSVPASSALSTTVSAVCPRPSPTCHCWATPVTLSA